MGEGAKSREGLTFLIWDVEALDPDDWRGKAL